MYLSHWRALWFRQACENAQTGQSFAAYTHKVGRLVEMKVSLDSRAIMFEEDYALVVSVKTVR